MITPKYLLLIFLFSFITLTVSARAIYLKITGYKVYFGLVSIHQQDWMVIRQFENEGKTYYLMVNPQTLETKIDGLNIKVKPMTFAEARDFFKNAPYIRAIAKAENQSANLQDAGIVAGMPKLGGISLTADLCPSHRPLDRRIFADLFKSFQKVELPVPIALSVTGVWMHQHPHDLAWLQQLQANGQIDITWINHSYTHRVSAKLPLKENFLLEPGTDVNYEVLETERAMLKNGLLPSVFFRFPGLVSNRQLFFKIADLGLIPLGSDAWLAKGQKPGAGSIVLIHANGNEPIGVNDFIKLLQQKASSIGKKQWLLYDLRESVGKEFRGSSPGA